MASKPHHSARGYSAPETRELACRAIPQLGIDDAQRQGQELGVETHYWRAVGAVDALLAKANAMGQCWLGSGARRTASAGVS